MDRKGLGALLDPDNRMFAMARQGRRTPHIVLATVMLVVLLAVAFIAGDVLERLLFGDVEPVPFSSQGVFRLTVPFGLMVVVLWVWLAAYERRSLLTIGLVGGGSLRKYLVGLVVGFGMIACTVGMMAITGSVQFESGGLLPAGLPAVGPVLLFLLLFLVQSAAEEVFMRGWYLPVTGARHGPWVGLVASSLLFATFHGFVNAVATVNFVLFAIFLALYCLYEGSIWGVCGWHAAWNWSQANVFGLDVTGHPPDGGVLVDLQATGSQLLSGGSYGPEGSLMGSASLLAGIVVLLILANRKAGEPAGA